MLRPAHAGDEEALGAFYATLSNESSHLRFFTVRRRIAWTELHRWVSRNLPEHPTVLAHLDGELVGVGEMHRRDEPHEAEVAFAVGDGHHGEGIATLLFEQLATAALACGITRFVAETLHENRAMQLVFRTQGCPVAISRDDDITQVSIELDAEVLALASAQRAAIATAAGFVRS
jgi:RimJ/RimL family protein N-acetyltransferase